MRCVAEAEGPSITKASVHLGAGCELFQAEDAGLAARNGAKGAGRSQRVAEFPWLVPQVLFRDEVFGDVPGLQIGRKDQLEFPFMLMLLARLGVGIGEIRLAVVTDDFEEGFVGPGGVFILHIEDGVDPVLAHQGAEAVFKPKTGEDSRILPSRLAI